jgi:large subunit ribosomal protein L22
MKIEKQEGFAIAKNIACSPYKLRPIVDVIRNKSVLYALQWLGSIYRNKKAVPLKKAIESAVSNLLYKKNIDTKLRNENVINNLEFSEIKVDQGPIRKYFKPGAQGRATILRTRYSHISVIVSEKTIILSEKKELKVTKLKNKGVSSGTKG